MCTHLCSVVGRLDLPERKIRYTLVCDRCGHEMGPGPPEADYDGPKPVLDARPPSGAPPAANPAEKPL